MPLIGRLTGRAGKVAYGFGNLGQALIFHSIGIFLIYFYVEKVGLDAGLVGLGFLLSYGIWNSINDPIAGYISDRTRTRWGRRIPFVLFFTLPMMLFFVLIWSPPIGGRPLPAPHNLWVFLYLATIVAVFELMYTFVVVGWNSLFPEMFQRIEERTEVSVYRQIAAIVGSIMGFVLTPLILALLTGRFGTFTGWTLMGTVLASVSGGAFLASLLGSKERMEFSMAGTLPVKTAFRVTFSNRSFLTAVFPVMAISWIWSFTSAIAPFAVVHMLRGTDADLALLGAPVFLVGILFYPLWRKICVRHGSKKTLATATSLSVLFLLILFLLADSVPAAIVIMGFYGFANSGVALVRELLVPDVIDEDEIKTGFRREGVYLGVTTFIDRFALALTGASMALVLGLAGFVPGVRPQQHVILSMRLASALVVVLALSMFLVFIKYYPLGAERVAEVRRALELRRCQAKAKSLLGTSWQPLGQRAQSMETHALLGDRREGRVCYLSK